MINGDRFPMFYGAVPLAEATAVWDITALGIKSLGWPIGVEDTDTDACVGRLGGDEGFGRVHEPVGDPLPLIAM